MNYTLALMSFLCKKSQVKLEKKDKLLHSPLVVDRVLDPVLAQGSTAKGSLTRRAKPEWLAPSGKMGLTTSTIIAKMAYKCKACMNITAVRLCADRVRCQPEVSMVTE